MAHRRAGGAELAVATLVFVGTACSSGDSVNGLDGGGQMAVGAGGLSGSSGGHGAQPGGDGGALGSGNGGTPGSSGAATANGGTANGGGGLNGSGGASNATGGSTGAGGSAKSSGGATGAGGAAGAGGSTSGTPTQCKRGIAANTPPGAAFFPAIAWWYNWAVQPSGADVGIEFVPMIWGSASVNATLPASAKYLLTFNEPNFHSQSNLTPAQAASYWPAIEAKAAALNVPIVSPAMNFCGPAANCNGTSPYQYLKDFFAACTGCKVDYVAVHWYNCDLPSLEDYLEPGGSLEGFEQFGKPIWLTEFSCDGSASVAEQETYMRAAVPYLESNPHVFRYSWFSADPIPNAKLVNSDGSPTALGNVYTSLARSCQ